MATPADATRPSSRVAARPGPSTTTVTDSTPWRGGRRPSGPGGTDRDLHSTTSPRCSGVGPPIQRCRSGARRWCSSAGWPRDPVASAELIASLVPAELVRVERFAACGDGTHRDQRSAPRRRWASSSWNFQRTDACVSVVARAATATRIAADVTEGSRRSAHGRRTGSLCIDGDLVLRARPRRRSGRRLPSSYRFGGEALRGTAALVVPIRVVELSSGGVGTPRSSRRSWPVTSSWSSRSNGTRLGSKVPRTSRRGC